jgi:ceramide glucosyltransferase
MQWFAAWLGREVLALPIWVMAVYGGVTVVWRDRRFKVGFDAKVREIDPAAAMPSSSAANAHSVPAQRPGSKAGKVRSD